MTVDIDGNDGWRATEMPAGSNDDSDGDLMGVVNDMGNPWVFFTLSVPVSICTHTHDTWVQVLVGFTLGTDMGKLPTDVGMGLYT